MSQKIKPKHHPVNAQLQYDFIPGPVKIKDGLFMGDELAAKDVEFIITNKVSHVINTVCRRIPNLWEKIGVQYLSFNWSENQQNVFDKKNVIINGIFNFIEDALEEGKACLVHSVNAKSRSFLVVAVYMMKKYGWTLEKTRDFVNSKKEKLAVRPCFTQQLKQYEIHLSKSMVLSNNWHSAKNEEQVVLCNTYKNSKAILYDEPPHSSVPKVKKKVGWAEGSLKQTAKQVQQKRGSLFKDSILPNRSNLSNLKSILKSSGNWKPIQVLKPEETQQQPTIGSNKNENPSNQKNGNIEISIQKNNFISSEDRNSNTALKKPPQNPLLTRPYSSDAKEREKKKQIANAKKLNYDAFSNFKSPYETKIINSKLGGRMARPVLNGSSKKEQEMYRPAGTFYQRPSSTSTTDQRRKNILKDEFVITNSKPVKLGFSLQNQNMAPFSKYK